MLDSMLKLLGRRRAATCSHEVFSPVDGTVLSLNQVADPLIAAGALGDGMAVMPSSGKVCVPVSGAISSVYPGGHAFLVDLGDEVGVLVHVGIDTVNLNGRGLVSLLHAGDTYRAGDPAVEVDLKMLEREGYDPTVSVFLLDEKRRYAVNHRAQVGEKVKRGMQLFDFS